MCSNVQRASDTRNQSIKIEILKRIPDCYRLYSAHIASEYSFVAIVMLTSVSCTRDLCFWPSGSLDVRERSSSFVCWLGSSTDSMVADSCEEV